MGQIPIHPLGCSNTYSEQSSARGKAPQDRGVIRGLRAASLCTSRRYLPKSCTILEVFFLSTPQGRPQMRPVTCKITLASALQMCDMPSDSLSQASEWPRLFAISSNDSSEILQHDSIFKRDESNESSSQRPGKARGEAIRQADRSTTGQHHSFPARHCSCA